MAVYAAAPPPPHMLDPPTPVAPSAAAHDALYIKALSKPSIDLTRAAEQLRQFLIRVHTWTGVAQGALYYPGATLNEAVRRYREVQPCSINPEREGSRYTFSQGPWTVGVALTFPSKYIIHFWSDRYRQSIRVAPLWVRGAEAAEHRG